MGVGRQMKEFSNYEWIFEKIEKFEFSKKIGKIQSFLKKLILSMFQFYLHFCQLCSAPNSWAPLISAHFLARSSTHCCYWMSEAKNCHAFHGSAMTLNLKTDDLGLSRRDNKLYNCSRTIDLVRTSFLRRSYRKEFIFGQNRRKWLT